MTPEYLQNAVIEIVKALFAGESFPSAGGTHKPLAVYPQDLPLLGAGDEEEGQYPYCIVRLADGTIEKPDGAQSVRVVLVFGAIDNDRSRAGYRTLLHLIAKTYQRFAANPYVAQSFICTHPIHWALQEEDSYPYFLGGMQLTFDAPAVRKEIPWI